MKEEEKGRNTNKREMMNKKRKWRKVGREIGKVAQGEGGEGRPNKKKKNRMDNKKKEKKKKKQKYELERAW